MNGKRRKYIAPSIGGAPAPKTAAAAAAEAAARRLGSLRRSAVEQQQQQRQQEPQYLHTGTHLDSSSPSAQIPPSVYTSGARLRTDDDAQTTATSLEISSSSTSPFCLDAQQQQQQQQQQFLPNSSQFLREGFSSAHVASSPVHRMFPQMPIDSPVAMRARAAAATTTALSSAGINASALQSIDVAADTASHDGRELFALPRPEPCRGTATAAAAAAAAAAARLRARGGLPAGPNSNAITASTVTTAPSPPLPFSTSPAFSPGTEQQTASMEFCLQRPLTTSATSLPPEQASAQEKAVTETRGGCPALPPPQHPTVLATSHVDTVAAQRRPSWWPPSKREREEGDGSGSESANDLEDEARKGRYKHHHAQTPITEADLLTSDRGKRDDGTAAEESSVHDGDHGGSSANATAVAAAHLSPTLSAVAQAKGGVGEPKSTAAPACGASRMDPVRMVVPAQMLTDCVHRLTAPPPPPTCIAATKAEDDEERELLESKFDPASDSPKAAAEATTRGATGSSGSTKMAEATMVEQLRAALAKHDRVSLRQRVAKAAALPRPPASLVLGLLEQLPPAPRRAVYNRDNCPCTDAAGFNEQFHECIQDCMTRMVLQHDGRVGDNAAMADNGDAPPHASLPQPPSRPTDKAVAEKLRYQCRVDELERGVQADVRDVVAFARFVTQQQREQEQQPKAHPAPHAPLTPLKTLVEAKLHLMQSTNTNAEAGPISTEATALASANHHTTPVTHGEGRDQGVDRAAVSPAVELSSSGGTVATSLAMAHQRFISAARQSASSRQEKAEAAQQAEQRLAAAAAAWRETFTALLQRSAQPLQDMQQHRETSNWVNTSDQGGANEEVLQRLQQFFLPHGAPSPIEAGRRNHFPQQQQVPWKRRRASKKERRRMRKRLHKFLDNVDNGQQELPSNALDVPFSPSLDE